MKALGILAGPRKGQVTDHLLDEVLKGLKDKGVQVKKVCLYDLKIEPCRGCKACKDMQECVINDDFKAVAEELINSEAIVFASPVYVSNVTSVAKAFFDRGVSLFKMTNFGPKWIHNKPRKVVLVTSCFAPFPFSHILGVVPGCVNAMRVFFGMMKAKISVISTTGMHDFNAERCKSALARAYRAGLYL